MKSLVDLSVLLLQDCGRKCGANPNRDILTVSRRTKHEGDSFLTITLPSFCKAFERCLANGAILPAHFPAFRCGRGTCFPAFLSGFTRMVFGPDGRMLDEPSIEAIRCIRQICLVAKKVLLPCTRARERAAENAFVECELSVKAHRVPDALQDTFKKVSRIIWTDILAGVPFGDPYNEYRPRHGPGTTREGFRGNKKFTIPSWPTRLEAVFPFTEFGIGSISNFPRGLDDHPVVFSGPRDELPVRVCFVPKTLTTPRVIAIEPVAMQYMQQAISDWLRPRIERLGRFTRGRVNFSDQTVNSSLALSSSASGSFATLDMSEASDRVSCLCVRDMLEAVPAFRRQVFATRSSRAELPSGKIIPLRKFASMGSALCFPMEAMAFFCAIVSSRIRSAGVRLTPRSVERFCDRVYVYGDDLIVPADEAPTISRDLELFGFKINTAKSFWTGKFRESCGIDAYDGEPVTPVYLRHTFPKDRSDAKAVVATVAFVNQLYNAGYWGVVRELRRDVESLLGVLPSISEQQQGLGWYSFSGAVSHNGWDKDLQRLNCRLLVPVPVRQRDPLEGDAALLKCFGLIGRETVSTDHLFMSVRYGNLALKRRWIPV